MGGAGPRQGSAAGSWPPVQGGGSGKRSFLTLDLCYTPLTLGSLYTIWLKNFFCHTTWLVGSLVP